MKKTKFGKIGLWASMLLSLCAVAVGAFSTMAWFQVNQRPLTGTVTSGSPDFTIESVTGYKDMPQVDETGYKGTRGSNITAFTDKNEGASSVDLGTNDENFNVPTSGDGYYLLVKDRNDEYKYLNNSTTKRFNQYETPNSDSTGRYVVRDLEFQTDSTVRIMKYTNVSHTTKNEPLEFSSGNYSGVTISDSTDISVAAGTYNIWLTPAVPKVCFEEKLDLTKVNTIQPNPQAGNRAHDANKPMPKNAVSTVTSGYKRVNVFVTSDVANWVWDDNSKLGFNLTTNWEVTCAADNDIGTEVSGKEDKVRNIGTKKVNNQDKTIWCATYSLGMDNFGNLNGWYNAKAFRKGDNGNYNYQEATGGSPNWSSYYNTILYTGNGASNYGFYYKVALHTGTSLENVSYSLCYANNYMPSDPADIPGQNFVGWYEDANWNTKYTKKTLTGDINLYAKYVPVHTYRFILNTSSLGGKYSSCNATGWTPHIYAWSGSGESADKNANWPGVSYQETGNSSGTIQGLTYYEFVIPDRYTNVLFNDGKVNHNESDDETQTIDLTDAHNHSGDYYIITGKTGKKWTGYWYDAVDAVATQTNDYYVYDKTGSLGTPKMYAWIDNPTTNSGTFYTNYYHLYDMALATSSDLFYGDHIYKVSVSTTYTNFKLQNSGYTLYTTDQTNGLTGHNSVSANNKYIYVLTAIGVGSETGTWESSLASVSYYVVYCLKNGNSYIPYNKAKEEVFTQPITTANSSLKYKVKSDLPQNYDCDVNDDTNGIHYSFAIASTLIWYTNDTFDGATTFSGDDTFSPSTYDKLYTPAFCDISTLVTFHIDASNWTSVNNIRITGTNGSTVVSMKTITNGLYRVTLPLNYEYRYNGLNGSTPQNNSWSSTTALTTSANTDGCVFRPASQNDGGNNTLTLRYKNISFGTATFWIDGEASDITMGVGDLSENLMIYETGVRLEEGQTVSIKITNRSSPLTKDTYDYDDLDDYNAGTKLSSRTYVSKVSNNDMTMVVNVTGRYTFYINSNNQLAMAEVPLLGNGFYIMPYVDRVTGFGGAIKMMTTDTGATYGGFNVSADNKTFFIRSYVDAVDTPYSDVFHSFANDNSTISVATQDGVAKITFKKKGKYTITVNKKTKKVSITGFLSDDSFSLNRLLPNATDQTIKNSYTSLVFEIGFKTTSSHTQPMKMSLDFINGANSYIGLAFYVGNKKLDNPYTDMRKKLYGDSPTLSLNHSSSGTLTSSTELTTGGAYYAYIIIDYWTTSSIPAYVSGSIGGFVLRATQSSLPEA